MTTSERNGDHVHEGVLPRRVREMYVLVLSIMQMHVVHIGRSDSPDNHQEHCIQCVVNEHLVSVLQHQTICCYAQAGLAQSGRPSVSEFNVIYTGLALVQSLRKSMNTNTTWSLNYWLVVRYARSLVNLNNAIRRTISLEARL